MKGGWENGEGGGRMEGGMEVWGEGCKGEEGGGRVKGGVGGWGEGVGQG